MDFGYVTPTRPPLGTAENTLALAELAEKLGFASVAVPDHVVPPKDFGPTYPYTENGRMGWGPSGEVLEMSALLAFLAGATTTLRLITGVMVVPLRNPLLVAKQLATLDVLSQGRIVAGCGVGWEPIEFATIGAPPFAERGRVTDEYLKFFKEAWTKDAPAFAGTYVRVADTPFDPKPVQKPHIPIWIGGESPPALRRAGQLGDAWYPIGSNQRYPLDTPGRYAAAVERVREHARAAGRDPDAIMLAYNALWYAEAEAVHLPSGERHAFTGGFADVADDVRRFADLGVKHIVLNLQAKTLADTKARMERFADKVAARLRA
jgi:probable F420-dependent oxidoreductase